MEKYMAMGNYNGNIQIYIKEIGEIVKKKDMVFG